METWTGALSETCHTPRDMKGGSRGPIKRQSEDTLPLPATDTCLHVICLRAGGTRLLAPPPVLLLPCGHGWVVVWAPGQVLVLAPVPARSVGLSVTEAQWPHSTTREVEGGERAVNHLCCREFGPGRNSCIGASAPHCGSSMATKNTAAGRATLARARLHIAVVPGLID